MSKVVKYFFFVCFCVLFFSCRQTINKERILSVTIEPQRYFAEQLVDTLFSVQTVVPVGTSPETYDPSPVQIANLSKSMAYFAIGYIGFEMQWLGSIKLNNHQLPVFDTSKGVDLIDTGEEHAHHHHDHHDHAHHHHGPIEPHIWTSPKQVLTIVRNMYQALVELDPDNASQYKQNLVKLEKEIIETDSILTNIFANAASKSFIIYHPALTYLARDYGLTQYCIENEGKEPSPSQLKSLIILAKESGVKTIFIQEEFDKKNAETIAKEAGCRLVTINPLSYQWKEELIRIAQAISYE